VYYFYQYTLRSAPAVMMPQLSEAFGLTALGVASMVGLFYWGYSPFSLLAGAAVDRLGPRRVVPIGAAAVGVGALLFASANSQAASVGRLLQGAGGVFALVGAVYIASTSFPPSRAATLIGATQMFGMAGGSAGQFLVGPMIASGVAWSTFWIGMGIAGLAVSVLLYLTLPERQASDDREDWLVSAAAAFGTVFRNPQSILCGAIAGLLFIPTTIFDMIWGVRYLQEARGFDYASAVLRSATVPLGWILGCPPYVLGIVAGLASGAAMLPYTVIKEANPPQMSGTATGVVNFLNFTFSALLGPAFGWLLVSVGSGAASMTLEQYQTAFEPLVWGVGLAIVLTLVLKETGPAVRPR
jgi:MFS family permease